MLVLANIGIILFCLFHFHVSVYSWWVIDELVSTALLSMISSLRTFSADKLQYWRESASGINRVAFFISKDVADLFNVFLKPLIYLSMFYFFSNPRSTFVSNYVVTLMLVYCVTGIAYIIAILLEPAPAQLVPPSPFLDQLCINHF